ncbi:autotransporter domain-containing protein [Allopusillimonas ginsengisoli]|uniref:autotransporter domain-containing protein n=1 Tax=Allopusillimonas ginsengisoli TaxID=453575 RepID=UPI00143147BE|nr:autotransporter domain-containing protein [Allopusillimonas ginsengisoli]
MNKIYCKVWSKVRNAMVVASELARGAGKGKNGSVRTSARSRSLNTVILAMALGGAAGMAQAADVTVDADGTTETLNSTDTYIKITASNGGIVDANGNAAMILGNDPSSDGSAVVVLESGAKLVLDGGGTLGNINTTSGSHGVDAQGTNTQATLNGVAISTKGDNSHALRVLLGVAMSVTDGTVLTEGENGNGYQVLGGAVEITGGTVTTQGKSASGVVADGDGIVTLKDGVAIKTQGESGTGLVARGHSAIDMSGGSITTVERAAMGVEADENSMIKLTDGVNITTAGDSATGIHAHGSSAVTLNDAAISTGGAFASGIFAYDAAVVTMSDGDISTIGNNAYGITTKDNAQATMTGGTITTTGQESHGILAENDSTVTLTDNVVISTTDDDSSGVWVADSAVINIAGGSINTKGVRSYGASAGVAAGSVPIISGGKIILSDGVDITTEGNNGFGLYTRGQGIIDMSGGSITTDGHYGVGAFSRGNGTARLSGVTITTTGAAAKGIEATQSSTVTLNDVEISTEENAAQGIMTRLGASSVTMSGGSIATQGNGSIAIEITDDSVVQLSNNVALSTQGNNASGISLHKKADVTMTGGSISTLGSNAHGVDAINDSVVALTGVDIETSGDQANGISTNYNAQATMTGGTITTTGRGADGVWATSNAQVTLNHGVVIRAEEESGRGIYAGSNAQVVMTGGSITTLKDYGEGLRLLSNGHITLEDGVAIHTQGEEANGAHLTQSSILDMAGGSITTEGQESHGILAKNDSTVTLTDNVAISTEGTQAVGIRAADNASVTMSGGSVSTQGALFYDAVNVTDAASVVLNDGVAISTEGDFAVGISSRDDSTVTMTGGSISTMGALAAGTMSDSNSTMTLNDVAITTVGDSAYGALVNDAAQLALNDTSITTSGADATGVVAVQFAQLALSNASITTAGADAMGLSVENDASVHLNQVTMDTVGASIGRNLYSSGLTPQPIIIENSNLTQNNGVLLAVTGSNLIDPTVLQLTNGTLAMGDITDVSTTNRNTLALSSGSQWTGVSRLDGNLTLTDAGTATHGGTVAAPIQISGDVTVNNGAALGGNLNVGGMLSGSSGTLRPGNSIGTQTFASAGSFTGDYHAEVNAAGQSDLITVTSGNFDLTGTNLYVDEADGNGGYKLDHDYTIVKTGDATGISGVANNEFANGGELEGSLAASLVKLDPVIYGDDVVKIRLSVDEAKQLTLTHNQNAVVEAAQTNPAVQKAVQMANYADALDHLSGEIHASTQTALLDTGNLMQRTLVNRMRGNSGSPSCVNTEGPDQDGERKDAACGLDYPLWAQVVGSWNHHDGDSNTASTRYRLGGLYLGGDKTFDNGWRVGGALGFTDGKIDADDRDSKADVKSYTAALYGGKGWALSKGQLNLLVGAGYTYHDIDTDRHTDVLGSQNLSAGYHANSTQLFAELGYALPVSDATYVEPYLNLGWADLRTKGFSESGGSTALQADSDHNQIFTQTLGLRGGTAFTAGKTDISLLAGLGWRHASGDLDATRTMAFSQGGGKSFEIKGAPIAKNAAVLDLGAEARLGENTALGLSYSGQFSSQGNDNTGSLYLRMKF